MSKENIKSKDKGFTLVEMIIVMAILAIISSLLFSVFYNLNNYKSLERDAAEVRACLEEARIYTQGSRNDSSYGVYFSDSGVTLFKGDSWITKEKEIREHVFNRSTGLVVDDISEGDEVVFSGLFGKPDMAGDITLSGLDSSITVSLLPAGFVE